MIDGTTIVALAVIFGMVAVITHGNRGRFRARFRGLEMETSPPDTPTRADVEARRDRPGPGRRPGRRRRRSSVPPPTVGQIARPGGRPPPPERGVGGHPGRRSVKRVTCSPHHLNDRISSNRGTVWRVTTCQAKRTRHHDYPYGHGRRVRPVQGARRMSAHSAVALSTRLKNTIRDTRAFYGGLEVWFAAPGFRTILTNSENEIAFGRRVRCLADDLQSLAKADIPVQARIGINSLRSLFDSLVKRWKWDRVVGPDGDAFLNEAWDLWTDRRRLYFSAVRSYVEAYAAGETTERPEEGYFYTAKDAEREGIPPSVPFTRSKEDLKPIQEAWIFSPYLGPEFPTRTLDDLAILTTALQDIEEGIRGTHLETSDSEPPARPRAAVPRPRMMKGKTCSETRFRVPTRSRHQKSEFGDGNPEPETPEASRLLQGLVQLWRAGDVPQAERIC